MERSNEGDDRRGIVVIPSGRDGLPRVKPSWIISAGREYGLHVSNPAGVRDLESSQRALDWIW